MKASITVEFSAFITTSTSVPLIFSANEFNAGVRIFETINIKDADTTKMKALILVLFGLLFTFLKIPIDNKVPDIQITNEEATGKATL